MTKPLRTQFVIADAGRARWVRRTETGRDFVTTRELTSDAQPPAKGPPGVVFESSTGRGAGLREARTAALRRRERFAEEISRTIDEETAAGAVERLALVAPPRTLSAICRRLSARARSRLAGSLPKDLTKVPDHELCDWLAPLELESRAD